jgi:hypothetical protein
MAIDPNSTTMARMRCIAEPRLRLAVPRTINPGKNTANATY